MITDAALYLAGPDDARAALLAVAGRPLAFRMLMAALRAGCRRVFVPAIFRGTALERWVARSPAARTAVVWDAPDPPDRTLLLLPAATLVAPGALAVLCAADERRRVLAGSRATGAPVATASAALVRALWADLRAGELPGDVLERALKTENPDEVGVGWCVRLRTAADVPKGEAHLYAGLGSVVDTRLDTLLHRRLSRPITRAAIALGLPPNAITLASLAVGLAGAWCLARGAAALALAGLALYLASVVLDHVDGEVARLTLTQSRLGEWLDVAADTVVHGALAVAMGLVAQGLAGQGAAVLGVVAALGFVGSAAMFKTSPPVGGGGVRGALDALSNRDAFYGMLLAFVVLRTWWPALLPLLMAVVAAGAHAFWVGRLLYSLRPGARPAPPAMR